MPVPLWCGAAILSGRFPAPKATRQCVCVLLKSINRHKGRKGPPPQRGGQTQSRLQSHQEPPFPLPENPKDPGPTRGVHALAHGPRGHQRPKEATNLHDSGAFLLLFFFAYPCTRVPVYPCTRVPVYPDHNSTTPHSVLGTKVRAQAPLHARCAPLKAG